MAFAIPLFIILCLYLLVGMGSFGPMPDQKELLNISNPLASQVYARNGETLGKYYSENRELLDTANVNQYFIDALVSVEDHRFYKHRGIDFKSLGRVFFKSILLQRDASGGGSTLTQQLVKNLYPRQRYKFLSLVINKFREMHIARRIERNFSKDQILWLYASTVSFGDQSFGLASASKRFFNKDQKDLNIEEAALLAGMLKATSYYSPRRFPDRAKDRRNLVLKLMFYYGYITNVAYQDLSKLPLQLEYQERVATEEIDRYFRQYLIKEFKAISKDLRKPDGSPYDLYYDGLNIYTSLDYDLQLSSLNWQRKHMTALQNQFEAAWKGGRMFGKSNSIIDDYILGHPDYQELRNSGLEAKTALDSFNRIAPTRLWNWDGSQQIQCTRIDSIKHYLKLLHSSLFAMDPESGQILVYIAGNDYSRFQFDNIQARRQVGSLFKPLAYLAALEGDVAACDYYKNELKTYTDYDDWTPRNADDQYGNYMSVHEALTHSVNTVSVQLLFKVGVDRVVSIARRLGIEAELDAVPSLVLGTSDISLMEMVRAYASMINQDKLVQPHAIMKIEDKFGNLIFEQDSTKQWMDLEISRTDIDTLLSMMFKVSTEGTARRLYNYKIPTVLFSKTGTTQNQSDGWLISGSKDIVAGAWVGHEDRRMHFPNLSTGAASRTALPLVGHLMEDYFKQHALRPIIRPILFDCPEELDSIQYQNYTQQQNEEENTDEVYGGWLKKIFGKKKKKRLNQRYEDSKVRHELKLMEEERKEKHRLIYDELDRLEKSIQRNEK